MLALFRAERLRVNNPSDQVSEPVPSLGLGRRNLVHDSPIVRGEFPTGAVLEEQSGPGFREQVRPAVDTQIGIGQLPSLWAIRFVTPNPSLCDLKIVAVIDRERMQQLCSAHLALHSGMIVLHVDADGPDRLHGQVRDACRHHIPDVENIRPCCVPEGCGSALDGKRRGTPVRAQTLLGPAEAAVCREDPKRYPERSFRYRRLFASRRRVRSKASVIVASRV